jgi:hypothetical protein
MWTAETAFRICSSSLRVIGSTADCRARRHSSAKCRRRQMTMRYNIGFGPSSFGGLRVSAQIADVYRYDNALRQFSCLHKKKASKRCLARQIPNCSGFGMLQRPACSVSLLPPTIRSSHGSHSPLFHLGLGRPRAIRRDPSPSQVPFQELRRGVPTGALFQRACPAVMALH